MTYYKDENKLTYDEAEQLVVSFIKQASATQTTVTCREVAKHFSVEVSNHNLLRLNDALSRMCEVHRERGSRTARYEL